MKARPARIAELVDINKTFVDAAKAGPKLLVFWDRTLTGFGLRVWPTGAKVYVFKYGAGRRGASRWVTIGAHGEIWRPDPDTGDKRVLTVKMARSEAERLRGLIRDGKDPAAELTGRKRLPTVAEFAKRYREEHSDVHKAENTRTGESWIFEKVIEPEFGKVRLDRIERSAVARWHAAMHEKKSLANRSLFLFGAMFTMAIRWEVIPGPNPCSLVKQFKIESRSRLIEAEELRRLGAALADPAADLSESSKVAILLLMFTGARANEICSLRWAQVEAAREVVVGGVKGLAIEQKGKTGKRTIMLPPPAVEVLARAGKLNEYVCPGKWGRGHLHPGALSGAWKRTCVRAGVPDCHLHDLRHLFISTAVEGGRSSLHAARLAGHATSNITEKVYTQLHAGPLLELAAKTATSIKGALGTVDAKEA